MNILKFILAIMLLICLIGMPYGYYQLTRWAATFTFLYLAYSVFENSDKKEFFIFIALAFLFQPFFKIALGRTLWNIVDIIIAIYLFFSITKKSKQ